VWSTAARHHRSGFVTAAAGAASDVTLLINNAGVFTRQNLVTGDPEKIRLEMDTNYFGTLNVVRAFAHVLAANGGGAILNVLSAMSWLAYDGANAYSAAEGGRMEPYQRHPPRTRRPGNHGDGLHLASTDTDMMAGWDVDKNDPADVCARSARRHRGREDGDPRRRQQRPAQRRPCPPTERALPAGDPRRLTVRRPHNSDAAGPTPAGGNVVRHEVMEIISANFTGVTTAPRHEPAREP